MKGEALLALDGDDLARKPYSGNEKKFGKRARSIALLDCRS